MIIVSQDRNSIVNFDNIAHIFIERGSKTTISYGKMNGCSETLGYYKTEERAKEVLEEIQRAYCSMLILPFADIDISDNIKGEDLVKIIAYKMPTE